MPKSRKTQHTQNVRLCRDELSAARESGNDQQICTAAASLGLALFQAYKSTEGLRYFSEAVKIAKQLDNLKLQVHCLGMKALAYQTDGRYPEAFRVAEEIFSLGEAHEDDGLRFDAFTSMGQIMMESGEPILALEKFQEAQRISDSLDDPRRAMHIRSAMGNHSLNVGSPDRAFGYFEDAMTIAISLGDKQTEVGLLGNLGTILSWRDQHEQAVQIFEQVLNHVREEGNKEIEGQTLRHLVNSHDQLKEYEKVLAYGKTGLALQDWMDDKTTILFYEKIILAHYRRNEMQEAESFTLQALEFSKSSGDESKELDLLLSLGESFVLSNRLTEALPIYKEALGKAKKMDRMKDAAYLTGRIGVTLAELGRLDEAIPYHESALEQAKDRQLPDLAGEQLSMLAMTYFEKGELDRATTYCNKALVIFSEADLQDGLNNARGLRAEIEAAKAG